jgi:hypothetical protein
LRVVDGAEKRLFLGHVGQQAEGRQADQKPVRWVARTQSERHTEDLALGRQLVEPIEHRRAELVQETKRKLHLRLHADGPCNPEPRGRLDGVLQKGRLADSGLPPQDERPALTCTQDAFRAP